MARFAASILLVPLALAGPASLRAAPLDVPPLAPDPAVEIVTTVLGEVGRAAVDGREYLTLDVGRPVGPLACRGEILRVELVELGDVTRRERIETAALSAVIDDRAVSVTVPLDAGRCADGRPVFTDIRPVPAIY